MGLYAMGVLAGLDIGYMTRRREDATRPTDARYVAIDDRLYELGRLGQKTGVGGYRYEAGRTQLPHPTVVSDVVEEQDRKSVGPGKLSTETVALAGRGAHQKNKEHN